MMFFTMLETWCYCVYCIIAPQFIVVEKRYQETTNRFNGFLRKKFYATLVRENLYSSDMDNEETRKTLERRYSLIGQKTFSQKCTG